MTAAQHVHDLRDFLPSRYGSTRAEEIPADVVTAAFDRATRAIWRAYRGDRWSGGRAGAVLDVPPGRWRLEPSRLHRRAGLVLDAPGTTLRGSGIRATVLELDSPEPAHTIAIRAHPWTPATGRFAPGGITIERLTVRGNLSSYRPKVGGHGVVIRDNAPFVTIRDVVIEDAASNGLGFERTDDVRGVFSDITLHNVTMVGSGRSAIDMKNYDADRPQANGSRSFFRNLAVHGNARNWDAGNPQGGQFAFHMRGHRQFQNVDVYAPLGIWFVNKDYGPVNGRGAEYTMLENYYVEVSSNRAIMAKAQTVPGGKDRTRLVTDPRDRHDPRTVPLEGLQYWTWPDGPPRPVIDDDFSGGHHALSEHVPFLGPPWSIERGDWLTRSGQLILEGSTAGRIAVDASTSDVDVQWWVRELGADRCDFVTRATPDGAGLVVRWARGESLVLVERSSGGSTELARTRSAIEQPQHVRIMASGERVEVYLNGATAASLEAEHIPTTADATGIELDVAVGGLVLGRARVDTLPVPRWNGAVRQVAPGDREQTGVRPRILPTPETPNDGWYVGSLDAADAGDYFTELWKNKALVVIEQGRVTMLEFELQGEGPGWLGDPAPDRAGLLVVGGPAVRNLAVDGKVLTGSFPLQIVQVSRDPATTGSELATRVWPTVRAVLGDGSLEGSVVMVAEPGMSREFRCGFRLTRDDETST